MKTNELWCELIKIPNNNNNNDDIPRPTYHYLMNIAFHHITIHVCRTNLSFFGGRILFSLFCQILPSTALPCMITFQVLTLYGQCVGCNCRYHQRSYVCSYTLVLSYSISMCESGINIFEITLVEHLMRRGEQHNICYTHKKRTFHLKSY